MSYSKDTWAEYYGGFKMPARYFALRLEGILDILPLVMPDETSCCWGCGIVLGPEAGYMTKIDVESKLSKHYVGISVGARADYRILDFLTLFAEPHFSIIPYTAPNNDTTSHNVNRNYYDALLNFNVGVEIYL